MGVGVKVARRLSLRRAAAEGPNVLFAELRGREVGRRGQWSLLVAGAVARVGRKSFTVVARRRAAVTIVLRLVSIRALLLARVEVRLLSVVGVEVLPEFRLIVLPVARLFGLSVMSSVSSSCPSAVADVVAARVEISRLVVISALPTLLRERVRLLATSFVGLLLSLLKPRTKAKGQSRPSTSLKQQQQQR